MELYESGENYLETILVLKNKNGYVRSIDIARTLSFSKPSVSRAMSLLKEGEYIKIDSDGYIELTDAGLQIAKKDLPPPHYADGMADCDRGKPGNRQPGRMPDGARHQPGNL